MDADPGTDLGALGRYVGISVTMSAAAMLPAGSADGADVLARSLRLARAELRRRLPACLDGLRLGRYALLRGIRASAPSFLARDDRGAWVAGGARATAGLHRLTPLKAADLRHPRSPAHILPHGGSGRFGAVVMGIEHGGYRVGCRTGLKLALFALGVTSLFWTVVVGAAILFEKAVPGGGALPRLLAVVLVPLGVSIAASPASVPGLWQPTRMRIQVQR